MLGNAFKLRGLVYCARFLPKDLYAVPRQPVGDKRLDPNGAFGDQGAAACLRTGAAGILSMIRKSGYRFSEKIMPR
jgi:hypothetical protein